VQSCQRLLGHRSLIGCRGLLQVLIQFLRHVLQDEIRHRITFRASGFVDNASSMILAGGDSLLKRDDAQPFALRTACESARLDSPARNLVTPWWNETEKETVLCAFGGKRPGKETLFMALA
jgi:hypothetical protein